MGIDYKAGLNPEQLRVVTEGDGPCLVLAGAGTGKTRTIVYRVAHLLEQGVGADRILLMTFTNKAAREMLRRVEVSLGREPKGLMGGTFHHVGSLILHKFGNRLGIAPNYTILDEDDRRKLLSAVLVEQGIDRKRDTYFPKVELLQELLSFSINSMRSIPEVVEEWIPKQQDKTPDILRISQRYAERKHERGVLDFDDLLALWLRLLREHPEVKSQLNQRFEYILVDEYQDTNPLQGAIVEELAGTQKNVLVVGDDAQSIYGFRAATVENIMRFPEIFPRAHVFRLEQNYRSTQGILDLANATLRGNRRQFQKDLRAVKGSGLIPEVIGCSDNMAEARYIVERVLEFHGGGTPLNSCAVLFRAAFHAMQIELELQKRGVPYVLRGGVRFFEQAHIKDIVAYLKVVANPRDEVAWVRMLCLEEGVGEKTAALIMRALEHGDTAALSEKVRSVAQRISARLGQLKTLTSVDKMIMYLLESFYEKYAEITFENAPDRLEDLTQLARFAQQYESLGDFLVDATLSEGFKGERTGASESGAEREYLVLSTIHQAKGLEWTNVFMVGLVDGQFPHYRAQRTREEMEEERRLFYVAVTRAKERLFLTYPIAQPGSFGMALHQPSLFVRELDPRLYKTVMENGEEVIEVG